MRNSRAAEVFRTCQACNQVDGTTLRARAHQHLQVDLVHLRREGGLTKGVLQVQRVVVVLLQDRVVAGEDAVRVGKRAGLELTSSAHLLVRATNLADLRTTRCSMRSTDVEVDRWIKLKLKAV